MLEFLFQINENRIGGVMISVLASSEVDRGFESRLGQTKDYTILYLFLRDVRSIKEKEQRLIASVSG